MKVQLLMHNYENAKLYDSKLYERRTIYENVTLYENTAIYKYLTLYEKTAIFENVTVYNSKLFIFILNSLRK